MRVSPKHMEIKQNRLLCVRVCVCVCVHARACAMYMIHSHVYTYDMHMDRDDVQSVIGNGTSELRLIHSRMVLMIMVEVILCFFHTSVSGLN